jgi:hypothetical protein
MFQEHVVDLFDMLLVLFLNYDASSSIGWSISNLYLSVLIYYQGREECVSQWEAMKTMWTAARPISLHLSELSSFQFSFWSIFALETWRLCFGLISYRNKTTPLYMSADYDRLKDPALNCLFWIYYPTFVLFQSSCCSMHLSHEIHRHFR